MAIHQEPHASVQRRAFGTTAEIEINGEVDLACVPELERTVDRALRAAPERVVVDLRGATFIDSSGIGALLRLRTRAIARQTDMIVMRPSGDADRIFEICGIEGVFPRLDGDGPG
jgi:anti-sigma B factor antagonist